MTIVGFNLDGMHAEKKEAVKGKVEVKNNIVIKSIEEKELSLGDAKKDGLKLSFEYQAVYNPEVGNIKVNGHLLFISSQKKMKDLYKYWQKENKLTEEVAPEIINTILMKCSVKTLNLAHDVNLPPNLSLPFLQVNDKKKQTENDYIG